MRTLYLAALALLVLTAPSAHAATSDHLDQSQMNHGSQVDDGVFSGDMEAQMFVAGRSGNLDRVFVFTQGNGSNSLSVSIQTTAPQTYLGSTIQAPTGVTLASASVVPSPSAAWVEVDFSAPANVTGGTAYAIVLSTSNGYFQTYGDAGTTSYPQGKELHWSGGWYQSAPAELAFQTYLAALPTSLSANNITVAQSVVSGSTTFAATLSAQGSGLSGKTVSFSMTSQSGTVSCSGTTDSHGAATCSLPISSSAPVELIASSYTAVFAGDESYQPSTATASVTLN